MKRLMLIICLFFCLNGVIGANEETRNLIKEYRASLNLTEMQKLETQLMETNTADFDSYLELATIDNFFADYYKYIAKNNKLFDSYVEKSIQNAEKAVALNNQVATAYGILIDGYYFKINGPVSAMKYGKIVEENNKIASKLDPEDPYLIYANAKRYLFAPAILGGSIDKALAGFSKLAALEPSNSLYNTFLGISYRKKGDKVKAKELFEKALSISSNNQLAKEQLSQMK